MRKIRKGDQVKVICGKDKGLIGRVLRILPQTDRVLVESANLVKKTVRANPDKGEQGGVHDKESPLHISNVMLYNTKSGKADRVGFKIKEDGSKVRYFKRSNEEID